ncbi:MAG TPA: Pr6Pr family membrane protein [Mycobacterium sp.]|nr:Pr6Pr family membrane protein [Mycobacterium sp.]
MRPRRHRLDNDHVRVLLRVVIVVAVVAALIAVETSSRSGVLWRLTTFTYQANVIAAAYYSWTLVSPRANDRGGIRGAVVLYVVVAGILWNLLLTTYSMGYTPANILLHVVVPVLAVLDWLVVGRGRVRWWQPLVWLVYPALYVVVALLVLNRAGRRAPYYFLDPDSVGVAVVAANIGLLAVFVLVLGYGISATGRRRADSPVAG